MPQVAEKRTGDEKQGSRLPPVLLPPLSLSAPSEPELLSPRDAAASPGRGFAVTGVSATTGAAFALPLPLLAALAAPAALTLLAVLSTLAARPSTGTSTTGVPTWLPSRGSACPSSRKSRPPPYPAFFPSSVCAAPSTTTPPGNAPSSALTLLPSS
ncbi:hypothetical protein B0H17DRAFT_1217600 [Mycena rosella]|uniref:Uncharacterized protein n=1 Tax=Mycena rosella TaxID=1033263 RepID=A0AAD7FQ10_MYCRO|nr:hypothetical protein B0H17DRAFT_1217600 [Mycena rosella]